MPISVGGVVFDGIEGTAWAKLTTLQLAAYQNAMTSFGVTKQASTSQGEVTVWSDATEYQATVLKSSGTRLVGKEVTVDFGFGTVVGVTVSGFEPRWYAKRGTSGGGMFEAKFTFDRAANQNDNGGQETTAIVQTGTVFGTWTNQPDLQCYETSDGLATYPGEGQAETNGIAPIDILGYYVRVLEADGTTERFVGKVTSVSVSGGGFENVKCVYQFQGVASILDQIAIPQWYEWGDDVTAWAVGRVAVVDPGDVLPFNGLTTGDRTAAVQTLPNATTSHLPARAMPGTQWTATQMLDTLLKIARQTWPYGPTWSVTGQTALLDGIKLSVNVNGLTLLEAIAAIIPAEQGVTFRFEHNTSTNIQIVVRSLSSDNAGAQMVDFTDSQVTDFEAGNDDSRKIDRFFVSAPRPVYISTFSFKNDLTGQLLHGWNTNPAQAGAAWLTRTGAQKDAPDTAMVWRRFFLNPQWSGGTDKTPGRVLGYLRSVDAIGQETGAIGAGGTWPNARVAIQFQRTLPIGKSRDWSAAYGKVNTGDEQDGVLAFAVKGTVWTPLHSIMQVQVGDDQTSIILGKDYNDSVTIKNFIDNGYRLVFTVAWVHPFAWRNSWIKQVGLSAFSTVDLPRSRLFKRQDEALQQIIMDTDTVVGLNATSGAPLYGDVNAGRIDGNDAAALNDLRTRLATIHGSGIGSVSWERGGHTVTAPNPGDLVTFATIPITTTTSSNMTVNAIISRRTFRFTNGDSAVRWTGTRLLIGTDKLLAAVRPQNIDRPASLGGYLGK